MPKESFNYITIEHIDIFFISNESGRAGIIEARTIKKAMLFFSFAKKADLPAGGGLCGSAGIKRAAFF